MGAGLQFVIHDHAGPCSFELVGPMEGVADEPDGLWVGVLTRSRAAR
jgi:hypothetical protein